MTEHSYSDAGAPTGILRFEALGVLAAACAMYAHHGFSWQSFAIFFLVPDLSMVGYAFGTRFGAAAYNAGHSYLVPATIGAIGLALRQDMAIMASLIWIAHIGFDRAIGYGLKYPDAFRHTHLG